MPSKAYNVFRTSLLPDVDALIALHGVQKTGARGRQFLGHITRSALILLCAAWEYYVEMLACNIAEYYGAHVDFDKLDNNTKSAFVNFLQDKNKGKLLVQCISEGWQAMLLHFVSLKIQALNTPKTDNVIEILKLVGIDLSAFLDQDNRRTTIDDFVISRGETAHKGGSATYPIIKDVKGQRDFFVVLVQLIDNLVKAELRSKYGKAPWQVISDSTKILPIG